MRWFEFAIGCLWLGFMVFALYIRRDEEPPEIEKRRIVDVTEFGPDGAFSYSYIEDEE